MALVDKLFGLVLIIAGLAIAAYWTVWQFLSLVSTYLFNFLIASFIPQTPNLRFLLGLVLPIQDPCLCFDRRSFVDRLVYFKDEQGNRRRESKKRSCSQGWKESMN